MVALLAVIVSGGDYSCGNYGNISMVHLFFFFFDELQYGTSNQNIVKEMMVDLGMVAIEILKICESQKRKVLYFSKL